MRGISTERRQHGFADFDLVAQFALNLRAGWQVNIRARAELNQTDPFATRHGFPGRSPQDDSPGNQACDQPHADLFVRTFGGHEAEEHVFVELTAVTPRRAEKLAVAVFLENDLAAYGRALDVHVEHVQKNRD